MIEFIFEILKLSNIGDSENIDIAKGKNKIPSNYKQFKKQLTFIKQRNGNRKGN